MLKVGKYMKTKAWELQTREGQKLVLQDFVKLLKPSWFVGPSVLPVYWPFTVCRSTEGSDQIHFI